MQTQPAAYRLTLTVGRTVNVLARVSESDARIAHDEFIARHGRLRHGANPNGRGVLYHGRAKSSLLIEPID